MPHGLRPLIGLCTLLVAFALGGCVQEPSFAQVAKTLPPPPAGTARIYVYHDLEIYVSKDWTPVYFNGREIGASAPGSVFFRDVPAGRYTVSILRRPSQPLEFKTVTLKAGEAAYIRVEETQWLTATAGGRKEGFAVEVVDPALAQAEMQDLQYMPARAGS